MRAALLLGCAAILAACEPAATTTDADDGAETASATPEAAAPDANAEAAAAEPTTDATAEPEAAAEPVSAPVAEESPPPGELDDRAAPTAVRLHLRIDPDAPRFSGEAEIDITIAAPTDLVWINGRDLNVTEAQFTPAGGDPVDIGYEQMLESGVAALRFPEPVSGDGVLRFVYDAELNDNLVGVHVTEFDGVRYVTSQMQDSDFRRAAPGFDQPRFKVPVSFTIDAPEGDIAITNAPTASETPLGDGWTRHVFATTRPLPGEVLAVIVGPYDVIEWEDMPPTDIRDRPVPLRAVTAQGKAAGASYALENTAPIVALLENYFGTPYPYKKLDLIAPTEFAAGAMENPGAITYRESILLIDGNASLANRNYYGTVHAHELAHMWFGDLVTPRWWDDVWLNESFASWMGNKIAAQWADEEALQNQTLTNAVSIMDADSLATARAIRGPIERTEDIPYAFSLVTYYKGAGMLAMFENYVGEDAFRDGVRLHMQRYEDGVADFHDFARSISEGSGDPELADAMATFVEQPGVPLITAELDCTGETPVAHVSQSIYRALGSTLPTDRRWHVPVCLSYVADGERGRSCALLKDETATIALDAPSCPSSMFPNADGAGYYRFNTDPDGWYALRAGFEALPPTEAVVFADSLDAAFRAGVLSASDYLDGFAPVAASSSSDVASAPRGSLLNAAAILPDASMDDFRAFLRGLYAPQWTGDVEGGDAELLAQQISAAMVFDVHDADRMAELTAKMDAVLENGGDAAAADLPGYALNEAVTAALMTEGADFYERMIEAVASTSSPALRAAAVSGAGNVWDPALAAQIRDDALNTDRFTGREMANIVGSHLGVRELRDDTWAWLQANFDAYVDKMPAGYRPGLGGVVNSWCDLDRVAEARAFIEAHAELIPGYERALAQSQESAELCAALRDAKGAELAAALAARR